ncbi:hypothetical protein LTR91_022393 [Friedmanniomyces endolithicus]|uniref:Sulphur transport domain-containing protein n=1 Tax=Friedmanniomyces endolithicus TaxID=329885 RepID=A0AAN6H5Q8_9PEZI|nr:hypothetical protein LTS09_012467 [Friedmanniomyces endolithicus]KAK0266019.1 hypothetical protein LTR35_016934 [Friedmanniomyces endolithicus]KAK0272244.1 hypothetical protein LTS00_016331 [Friedmanniomyces endolithicus]KAK0303124.1 hypothetical protein LTR01_008270 [Friedmanniomyces endolithicus]KAK0305514.1 hypothetical protein LTR82_016745 [Friedmanniomyces endolithicus]
MMLADVLYSGSTGAVFGMALTASRVHLPSVIINQFELTDSRMMQVFAVAMGSSAAAMFALERLGVINRPVRPQSSLGRFSSYDGNFIGGALVGVGMALTGACPGTVLIQLAQGFSSAKNTAIGALLGAGTYVRFKHVLKKESPNQDKTASPSPRTISDVSKIPEMVLYLLLAGGVAGFLFLTSAKGHHAVSPVAGGLLLGAAQGASLLLTAAPLGVSTMYEQLSQYILTALGNERVGKPKLPPKSIIFALGMVAGSIALTNQTSLGHFPGAEVQMPIWQALAGGYMMGFGARLAGGCTSGHGLSGLSALSFSSLVTVASMFGAAILTRQLM